MYLHAAGSYSLDHGILAVQAVDNIFFSSFKPVEMNRFSERPGSTIEIDHLKNEMEMEWRIAIHSNYWIRL